MLVKIKTKFKKPIKLLVHIKLLTNIARQEEKRGIIEVLFVDFKAASGIYKNKL